MWPFPECADFASGNFLFGACELTKISDSDKYSYSKYVWFDTLLSFSKPESSGFGPDMSLSVYIDNKK